MDHIAPLFIVGFAGALIGWAMMVLAARIEHDRQERHAGKFGKDEPTLPPMPSWARLVSSWLMPQRHMPVSPPPSCLTRISAWRSAQSWVRLSSG
jgi:hypothetical protein